MIPPGSDGADAPDPGFDAFEVREISGFSLTSSRGVIKSWPTPEPGETGGTIIGFILISPKKYFQINTTTNRTTIILDVSGLTITFITCFSVSLIFI